MAEEIVIKLSDGTEFKGSNHEELVTKLGKAKEDTAAYASQQKQEAEAAKLRAQQLESQLAEAQRKLNPAKKTEGFDNDTYYSLITAGDPIGAQNYLDAYRFGITDPAQVPASFNYMRQVVDETVQQNASAQFLQRHVDDYDGSPQNNNAMGAKMKQLVEQEGFRFSVETMDYAYSQLVKDGTIKPKEKEQEQETANPALGTRAGAGGGKANTEPDLSSMSDEDLAKYGRSKGWV